MGEYNNPNAITVIISADKNKPAIRKYRDKNVNFPNLWHVEHKEVNSLEEISRLFRELSKQEYTAIQSWACSPVISKNNPVPRVKRALKPQDVMSNIGFIDIDEYKGKKFVPKGHKDSANCHELPYTSFKDCALHIIEEYFPEELRGIGMHLKPSSGYYLDGYIKFHITTMFEQPVKQVHWHCWAMENMPELVDKVVSKNDGQLLYTALPNGQWEPLVNPEYRDLLIKGRLLKVPPKEYIDINLGYGTAVNIDLEGITLKEAPTEAYQKKLDAIDMSKNCNAKSYFMNKELLSKGYDFEVAMVANNAMLARPDKAHKVTSQRLSAKKAIDKLCIDPFSFAPRTKIDGYVNLSGLVSIGSNDLPKVNLIKATTGLGKTEGLRRLIPKNSKVVVVSPRKLLVAELAKMFDAVVVWGGSGKGEGLLGLGSISTTIHSLYKLDAVAYEGVDYLIIDEAAQNLAAHMSLDDKPRKGGESVLATYLSGFAKHVILMDADLTNTTISGYKDIMGDFEVGFACNAYKEDFKGRTLNIYESAHQVTAELLESLEQGYKCLVIGSDVQFIQSQLPRLVNKKDNNHIYLTSEEDDTPIMRELRESPTKFVSSRKDLKLLATTSILSSGVSFVNKFNRVFVYAPHSNQTASIIMQQLSRERHWIKGYVCTTPMNRGGITATKEEDRTKAALHKEETVQLSVRPYRLGANFKGRGGEVNFINPEKSKLNLDDIKFVKFVPVSRDDYPAYRNFLTQVCVEVAFHNTDVFEPIKKSPKTKRGNKGSKGYSTIANSRKAREGLLSLEGGVVAVAGYLRGDRVQFFEWVKEQGPFKIENCPKTFATFPRFLRVNRFDDKGAFDKFNEEGITYRKATKKGAVTRAREILRGCNKPDDIPFQALNVFQIIMDKFAISDLSGTESIQDILDLYLVEEALYLRDEFGGYEEVADI